LCTQRSVSGSALKSSSSAILKQLALIRGTDTDVELAVVADVATWVDSSEGPGCLTLFISFWSDEHSLIARILTGTYARDRDHETVGRKHPVDMAG